MAIISIMKSGNLVGEQVIPMGWKSIHLYCITESGGKQYFYRVLNGFIVETTTETVIKNPEYLCWDKLNPAVKEAHLRKIDPGGSNA